MEFKCSVSSVDEAIDYFGERDLFGLLNRPDILRDHPDFSVSRIPSHSGYNLFYRDCDDNSVVYKPRQCQINYPWLRMNKGETLLYSSYPLLEAQRQARHWLTAYSAAVSMHGDGILLFGKSGAGKTSVTVDLCRRYGAQLVGNDLTILGLQEAELFIKGGTKFLFLRYESVRKSLPDLVALFPELPREPWLCKIKVNPQDLGIKCQSEPVKVKRIFSLHIDENLPGLYVEKSQDLALKLFLIENFSRYIKGSCINVLGGNSFDQLGFIPSYDRKMFFKFRENMLNEVLSQIKYISGPLKLVSDYIAKDCS